jgi:hypothetical protein
MSQNVINVGAVANDGTGASLRIAFDEVNDNFSQIWASGPVNSNVVIANNIIATNGTNQDLILSPNGIGNIQTNSHIVPSINSVYDLGSYNSQYDTVWTRNAEIGYANIANFTSLTIAIDNLHITGGANAYVLQTDGTGNLSWTPQTGGNGGIPGGSNTQVQFNNANVFGGNASFTFNTTTSTMAVIGTIRSTGNISATGNTTSGNFITSGASGNITGANVIFANTFVGNGASLTNVLASRGADSDNWDTNTQMGVYVVNRTSWAGTTGTPLDSQVYVGLLEVKTSTSSVSTTVQNFYPGTINDVNNVKIQFNRSLWNGAWTSWIKMTNNGQQIDGGSF